MKRLANAHELLDGPLDDPRALRDNLRDLRRINMLLRGAALSRAAVLDLVGDLPEARVIDVGTGAADIPLALLRAAGPAGAAAATDAANVPTLGAAPRLSVVAVDSRPEVLAAARALDPSLDRTAGLELRVGDGRSLDWPDRAFDVAHSSMTLHHLDPPDAVAFLRELRRVSRCGVVVNDLARGTLWWAFARFGTPLVTGNRLTRHDAPLSVRRSYTARETRRLLSAAGLRPIAIRHALLGHRFALAAVPIES